MTLNPGDVIRMTPCIGDVFVVKERGAFDSYVDLEANGVDFRILPSNLGGIFEVSRLDKDSNAVPMGRVVDGFKFIYRRNGERL